MVKENECGLMECSTQRNNSKMCVGEDYALYVYTIKPERKRNVNAFTLPAGCRIFLLLFFSFFFF